jgi:ABC-type transport system substrate-binding protein
MEITALIFHKIDGEVLDSSKLMVSDKYIIIDNMTAKLIEFTKQGDYAHSLADSIEQKDKTYFIKIKKAFFSDGSKISANDVVSSFRRIQKLSSAHVPLDDLIECDQLNPACPSIKALSEDTLSITLNKNAKEFLYYLSLADMGILHKSQYSKDINTDADWKITSGPYRLENGELRLNKQSILARKNSPSVVKLKLPPDSGSTDDFIGNDIGDSGFLKKDSDSALKPPAPYRYATINYNMLCYLVLNHNSKKFKKTETRQSIHRNIAKEFKTPSNNQFFKKANQFFTPDSFASQKTFNPLDILPNSTDLADAKDGFKILATKGTRKYIFENLEEELKKATGLNVVIEFTDTIQDYYKRKELRNFDAYLVPTSMTYHVLTESLNILYRAKVRFADNPNGRILNLIDQYQTQENKPETIIKKITEEMTLESEVIPLYYLSNPYFYNSNKISISNMNTDESLKFWEIDVI